MSASVPQANVGSGVPQAVQVQTLDKSFYSDTKLPKQNFYRPYNDSYFQSNDSTVYFIV